MQGASLLIKHRFFYEFSIECFHFKASDNLFRLMDKPRILKYLKKIRRRRHPACPDIETFHQLLETNQAIGNTFGTFRDKQFYMGHLAMDEKHAATVFGIQQFADKVQPGADIFLDGTFSIVPLKFTQLYILLAMIDGEYFCQKIMNSFSIISIISQENHVQSSLL